MKTQKFFLAVLFVFALALTSCNPESVAEEDSLYETEAVDLSKGHRPGTRGD